MSAVNLSLRTCVSSVCWCVSRFWLTSCYACLRMAVWGRTPYIVVPLSIALLAFGGVLLRGVIGIEDVWVPGSGCTIVNSQINILRSIYIYGMSLDFVIMCLTMFKLVLSAASNTPLVTMLVQDGLVYFAIS